MKKLKNLVTKSNIFLLILIIFSLFFFFFQLGENKLIEYDEGIYGVVSQNVLKTGDLVTLTWKDGNAWFDKGPLYFWLSAVAIKFFGQTAFAVRFFSALFGLLSIILAYLIGKKLFSERVGSISGFILASSTGYIYYSRLGMLDVPTAFFICLSLYFLILGREALANENIESCLRNYSLAAVALSGAFLLRGFIGLTGLISFALFILIFDGWRGVIKNLRQAILPLLLFAVLTAPWHILMYLRYGNDFITTYFSHQMFSRFADTIEGKSAPRFWYLTVIRTQFRIWFIPLIPAFFLGLYGTFKKFVIKKKNEVGGLGLILIWTVTTFAIFTAANSKLIWYILPIYPALSILTGWSIDKALSFAIKRVPLPEVSLTFVIIVLSLFYNFRMWGKIKSEDFNKEAVAMIEAKNRISSTESLCCSDVGWSVCQFYAFPARVVATQTSDLAEFLKAQCSYGIARKDSIRFDDSINIISEIGDYLLLTSPKSDKIK